MKISELKPARGAVKRRKIVGKGPGSGHGKTATRGNKGQNSRTGGGVRPGFEGGQTPIYRKLPMRGFKSIDKVEFDVVNVDQLSVFENGSTVTPEDLKKKGFVGGGDPVKVLGNGELKNKLTVKAHAFSASASSKIKAAGGTTEVL
jgi:large subunit ribosomal protein L15